MYIYLLLFVCFRWVKLVTGKFLFFSPNLVWLTIALLDYFFFPYDYEAAKSLTNLGWVYKRFGTISKSVLRLGKGGMRR